MKYIGWSLICGILIGGFLLLASWADAQTHETYEIYRFDKSQAEVKQVCETINKKEVCYLDVRNKHIHLKVWPCGKVKKEVWKELNPNEETEEITSPWSGSRIIIHPNTYGHYWGTAD